MSLDPARPSATAGAPRPTPPILQVRGLRIETLGGTEIVDEIDFEVRAGEVFALVGESGCGKSSVALGLLGYARAGSRISRGEVRVRNADVLALDESSLRRVRGAGVAYVPQDPSKGLSPRRSILSQMMESLTIHGVPGVEARRRCRAALHDVGLPDDETFAARFPFELSGGQQQRVLIAIALVGEPDVIVFDEPTTALDATTQKTILDLVRRLSDRGDCAFVYVTHDLAVVQRIADRIGVMYSGRLVEVGPSASIFAEPSHPYTALLLASIPSVSSRRVVTGIPGTAAQPGDRPEGCFFRNRCPVATDLCATRFPADAPAHGSGTLRCHHPSLVPVEIIDREEAVVPEADAPELDVRGLVAAYGHGAHATTVVHGVGFTISAGECLAIVGESGSGKSTTGRCIAGLHRPAEGEILFNGEALPALARDRTRHQLRELQVVFQNPDRSLNPSHRVRSIVGRPLEMLGGGRATRQAVGELLERVQLSSRVLDKYPGELSGGEKQRVAIARALAAGPSVLICDEVTSALDVSVQATIVNLLDDLRQDGLAMLFITHNLGVVRSLANRVLVMQSGRVIDEGPTATVFEQAQHPYTRELYAAVPEVRRAV